MQVQSPTVLTKPYFQSVAFNPAISIDMEAPQEQLVSQEGQVEPIFPGVTQEAFNYLVNIATNNELPQILQAQDLQFEVLHPLALSGTGDEAGLKLTLKMCQDARKVINGRLDQALGQITSWTRASMEERTMLHKIDEIQSAVMSTALFQRMHTELQNRNLEDGGLCPASVTAMIEDKVEEKVKARLAEVEDRATKRYKIELDKALDRVDVRVSSVQNELNTKVNTPDLDKLVNVKVAAVIDAKMASTRDPPKAPPYTRAVSQSRGAAIGAAPAASASSGVNNPGNVMQSTPKVGPKAAFSDVRLRSIQPLEAFVDPRAYVKDLVRIRVSEDGVEVVDLYHPSDYDVDIRAFKLQPWKSDSKKLEVAKKVKSLIYPHSVPGDRHPMVNSCVGGLKCDIQVDVQKEIRGENRIVTHNSTVRLAGLPRFIDEREALWAVSTFNGILPGDSRNPIILGVNFSREPRQDLSFDSSFCGVLFVHCQSIGMANLMCEVFNDAGPRSSFMTYPFTPQVNPPLYTDSGRNRAYIEAKIARDSMARDASGQRGDGISSTRYGADVFNFAPRIYLDWYHERFQLNDEECEYEVVEAQRVWRDERKMFKAVGMNRDGLPYAAPNY